MPIIPKPAAGPPVVTQDKFTDASFQDVTLVHTICALIASGNYAPGPKVMELAIAATAQIMVQTGRWAGTTRDMTLAQAGEIFARMGQR